MKRGEFLKKIGIIASVSVFLPSTLVRKNLFTDNISIHTSKGILSKLEDSAYKQYCTGCYNALDFADIKNFLESQGING